VGDAWAIRPRARTTGTRVALFRILITSRTDPATVSHVLQLHANTIGIDEVQLVRVATDANHRLDAQCRKFGMGGLRIEAFKTKKRSSMRDCSPAGAGYSPTKPLPVARLSPGG
jgi:hypothetical protein